MHPIVKKNRCSSALNGFTLSGSGYPKARSAANPQSLFDKAKETEHAGSQFACTVCNREIDERIDDERPHDVRFGADIELSERFGRLGYLHEVDFVAVRIEQPRSARDRHDVGVSRHDGRERYLVGVQIVDRKVVPFDELDELGADRSFEVIRY